MLESAQDFEDAGAAAFDAAEVLDLAEAAAVDGGPRFLAAVGVPRRVRLALPELEVEQRDDGALGPERRKAAARASE